MRNMFEVTRRTVAPSIPTLEESGVRSSPVNDQIAETGRHPVAEGRVHSGDETAVFSESALRAKAAARPFEYMKHHVEEVQGAYRRNLESDPTVLVPTSPEVARMPSSLPPRLTQAQQMERDRLQTEASVINASRLQQQKADQVRRAEQEARFKANPFLRNPLEQQIRAREEREAQEVRAKIINRPRVVVTGEEPQPIPLAHMMETALRPAQEDEEELPFLALEDGDMEELPPTKTVKQPPQITTFARNTLELDKAGLRADQDRREAEFERIVKAGAYRQRTVTPEQRSRMEEAHRALQAIRRTQWPSAAPTNNAA